MLVKTHLHTKKIRMIGIGAGIVKTVTKSIGIILHWKCLVLAIVLSILRVGLILTSHSPGRQR